MNKIIIISIVIAVSVVGFLSIPNNNDTIVFEIPDTDNSKIIVGDVELLVSNDDIIDLTVVDQLLSEPPDITIPLSSELPLSILNEVQYSFEEDVIDDEITVNKYVLNTVLTYNDGSESIQSSFVDLQSLDFITLNDMTKEFNKGKISFNLSVPINKQIRLAQSEFTVNYVDSNNNVKTIKNIFNTKTQSDVKDGMIVFLDDDVQFDSILEKSSLGKNKLIVTLDKLFIIYDDNSREYASPNTLYSAIIEKSNAQYIITNELGNTKIWDYDIPLTISTSTQSVTAETCVTTSSTGCSQTFQSFYKVASPKLGHITITNLDNNNELVRTDVVSKSSCINNIVDSEINLCEQVGDGTKFTFMLQRDTQYRIEVGSPQNESFIINTPINDDSYNYTTLTTTTQTALPQKTMTQEWCSKQTGVGYNAVMYNKNTVNNMGKVVNADKNLGDNGICEVRYNTSLGQAWYNFAWKAIYPPIEYTYSEKLTSNFP